VNVEGVSMERGNEYGKIVEGWSGREGVWRERMWRECGGSKCGRRECGGSDCGVSVEEGRECGGRE